MRKRYIVCGQAIENGETQKIYFPCIATSEHDAIEDIVILFIQRLCFEGERCMVSENGNKIKFHTGKTEPEIKFSAEEVKSFADFTFGDDTK